MKEIYKAMLAAQKGIHGAVKDAQNPHFRSSYADLQSIIEAIKEPLNNAGIVITQPLCEMEDKNWGVMTILTHAESGEQLTSTMPVICKDMTDPQKWGSAITYARRYTLQSLVALPALDDDGNEAAKGNTSKQKPAPTPIPPKTPAPAYTEEEKQANFAKACAPEIERIGPEKWATLLGAWRIAELVDLDPASRQNFLKQLKEMK
jgi:hypothetical protein